jgi:hypothetical protein
MQAQRRALIVLAIDEHERLKALEVATVLKLKQDQIGDEAELWRMAGAFRVRGNAR